MMRQHPASYDGNRPIAFRPDGDRAAFLNARIAQHLAQSIAEIARACLPHLEIDQEAIGEIVDRLGGAAALRPIVFCIYYDLLSAARRDDLEATEVYLKELMRTPLEAEGLRYRRWGAPGLEADTAERYSRYVNSDPSTPVVFETVNPQAFEEICATADRAFGLLNAADPQIAAEVKALIRELIFVSGSAGQGMRFNGATCFYCWGALFLNADEHRDPIEMVDGLAHESAHALLFGFSLGDVFVDNPPDERHPSPLRVEPRPLDGIYHATYVSARMHYAHSRLLKAGVLSPVEAEQAREAQVRSRRAFNDGMTTLDRHARLTSLGGDILRGAREYMSSA